MSDGRYCTFGHWMLIILEVSGFKRNNSQLHRFGIWSDEGCNGEEGMPAPADVIVLDAVSPGPARQLTPEGGPTKTSFHDFICITAFHFPTHLIISQSCISIFGSGTKSSPQYHVHRPSSHHRAPEKALKMNVCDISKPLLSAAGPSCSKRTGLDSLEPLQRLRHQRITDPSSGYRPPIRYL